MLAAIMFTDITGFSAMMQSSEQLATQVRNRHRSVFKISHEKFNGKILQYFGDGTLSIFESVSAAVECAVEMQIEFRKEPEVPLRIGIHTGDITYDEEGAYGNSMNIASRVENLAVPGSIFITSKVYDDIKNHSWLTGEYLGSFKLRNIFHNVDIFAVRSKGMIVPVIEDLAVFPDYEDKKTGAVPKPRGRGRRKGVAFLLALLFGVFGVHRFYLGQRGRGIAMLVISIITLIGTIEEGVPLIAIMGIIAFIDAILLLFMPRLEFDNKYNVDLNREVPRSKKRRQRKQPQRIRVKEDPTKKIFDTAVREYKRGRHKEAVELFDQVLTARPDDYLAHFYLARIFSLLFDKEDAFFHLEKSVEFGFDDFEWLEEDTSFEFLRDQAEYSSFRNNGYRKVAELPEPTPDLLENLEKFNPEILDRIEELGDQMERGEISREQFDVEKKKILGGGK